MTNTIHTLKNIAIANKGKLSATFSLVALENILFLLYPLVGSFAVNAVLAGDTIKALIYAFMVFVIWLVGLVRRAVDTRAFVRIYADLAVKAITNAKQKDLNTNTTSTRAAHAILARQFVDFFEEHLPVLITALFNIIGSVLMLLMIEFYAGLIALVILLTFMALLPTYSKQNDKLYFKLNNRLENEVSIIEKNHHQHLIKHYDLLAKIRIAISNREAFSYLLIGISMAILFGATLVILSNKSVQAGHIYAVITYLWGFAMSLDDMPRLMEKMSELKDVGQRVAV